MSTDVLGIFGNASPDLRGTSPLLFGQTALGASLRHRFFTDPGRANRVVLIVRRNRGRARVSPRQTRLVTARLTPIGLPASENAPRSNPPSIPISRVSTTRAISDPSPPNMPLCCRKTPDCRTTNIHDLHVRPYRSILKTRASRALRSHTNFGRFRINDHSSFPPSFLFNGAPTTLRHQSPNGFPRRVPRE